MKYVKHHMNMKILLWWSTLAHYIITPMYTSNHPPFIVPLKKFKVEKKKKKDANAIKNKGKASEGPRLVPTQHNPSRLSRSANQV